MVPPPLSFFQGQRTEKTNPVPLFVSSVLSLIALYTFLLLFRRSVRGGTYA